MMNYPQVKVSKNNKVYVQFYINKKRYRLFNGSRFKINISPNTYPVKNRVEVGYLLAERIFKKIIIGKRPNDKKESFKHKTDIEIVELALYKKLNEPHSYHYKKALKYTFNKLKSKLITSRINKTSIENILNSFSSNTSYNTLRRNLNILFNQGLELGLENNPIKEIKRRRAKSKLHKPITNLKEILRELRLFNNNLHLCALLTYGCLLRPHREILNLRWCDFNDDLTQISLPGNKNKSGRNRVVPVPNYIREILVKGNLNDNIFSSQEKPFNRDYFKTLWARFKKVSTVIEDNQTLYSFRHSGAIEIFKRTGSLTKLQRAMGHSSLQVSLTYLRGLEVTELKEEDMPMV